MEKRRVATIGTFDGLHRGHQRVISYVEELAAHGGMEPLVITFDRHPRHTLDPANAPRHIMAPEERRRRILDRGVSLMVVEFTRGVAAMSAAEWLRKIHREERVDVLVLGYDNKFGNDGRSLSFADYRRLGEAEGVEILEAPYHPHASSTSIRKLVNEGRMEEAASLLGHSFVLTGRVVEGKHLGSAIGFPTANISVSPEALVPANGVYAAFVRLPDGTMHKCVVNIGTQPTVGLGQPLRIEVHIPGFPASPQEENGNLYGLTLNIFFGRKLRDEKKFESIEELKAQIGLDCESAMKEQIEKPD